MKARILSCAVSTAFWNVRALIIGVLGIFISSFSYSQDVEYTPWRVQGSAVLGPSSSLGMSAGVLFPSRTSLDNSKKGWRSWMIETSILLEPESKYRLASDVFASNLYNPTKDTLLLFHKNLTNVSVAGSYMFFYPIGSKLIAGLKASIFGTIIQYRDYHDGGSKVNKVGDGGVALGLVVRYGASDSRFGLLLGFDGVVVDNTLKGVYNSSGKSERDYLRYSGLRTGMTF